MMNNPLSSLFDCSDASCMRGVDTKLIELLMDPHNGTKAVVWINEWYAVSLAGCSRVLFCSNAGVGLQHANA
jgi:hypothetical protein